ncbi:MAG: BTAD domain-containing putative transcriptional regulator [Coriobacteriia bacterium]|nr:BTAD domain-containing putative transcriptional regulator [Coriobacteriia bacterium]
MGEMLGSAVPDVSGMLLRSRLVDLFHGQAPPLTLVCAAAGYGKSVLAAQLARSGSFDVVIWVEFPDVDANGDLIMRQLADSLEGETAGGVECLSGVARSLETMSLDDAIRVRDCIQRHSGTRVLLAIDGVNSLSEPAVLESLARAVGRYSSPGSRVVVTCRSIEDGGDLDPGAVWLLEEHDLAFSVSEVHALISDVSSDDSELAARTLHKNYSGHPAITRIMVRHGAPSADVRPRDLIWQTERIVARFAEKAVAALYLAAILREGELNVLDRCGAACDLSIDWWALSRGVPLLSISSTAQPAPTFRVHAVLADVVARVAIDRLHERDREAIREVAFDQLSRVDDYVSLASALELHGAEAEIATWCTRDGLMMVRHAGHAVVGRLLCRLSPLSMTSCARLLLLRAHVQRASGADSAAIASAAMAKRIAEIERDGDCLIAAVLLIARLQTDRGALLNSYEDLVAIDGNPALLRNPSAACMREAYLAQAEAHLGRIGEAVRRTDALREMLRVVDQGSDEAVFSANCLGAIQGQTCGDWASALPLLAALASRTDTSYSQARHIRTNHAAVLVELGRTREAEALVVDVLADCESMRMDLVHAAALGTLLDATWLSAELAPSLEIHQKVTTMCQRTQDLLGLATHNVNAARALRALSAHDESLGLALTSESLLSGYGPGADVIRLMAQIEIAASQLALGDVDAAEEGIIRVMSVPLVQDATGHLLRCDLVLAEIDRRRGAAGKAITRLRRHKEYMLSGSANMTLACYIRAFPGLLGLVGVSLGRALLPSRILRLLPHELVGTGLDLAEQDLPADKATILRRRYGAAGGDPAPATDGAKPEAFCNLRMFGRLEVTTSFGAIPEKGWEKRKGRLMLLMLACHPGREMTRDAMVERLWSHMERERALRNLYVTWSGLRRVLACGNKDVRVDIFAGSNNDALWLTDLVRSDLDEFQTELRTLRSARIEGESEVVVATALRLSDIYRGDLLPIDIYEKWFEEERNRTRREFCDAMVTGAQAAFDIAQYDTAMAFLRRASDIDHLREDIYQLMMKCQMNSGQRSGAIDTYNTCRSRLVDDLGIDPCSETNRLFQAVLAMEDDSSTEPPDGESDD